MFDKSLFFSCIMILVGHEERNFSLQTNLTKDTTSLVQWVKDFSIYIFSLHIIIAYGTLITLQH